MDSNSQAQAHKVLTNFLLSQPTHRPSSNADNNDIASPPPSYSFHQEQYDNSNSNFNPNLQYESEDEEYSTLSPITITISTPLHITGTSNLVLLPPPSTTAKSIALEVMRALNRSAMDEEGEGGIPMIDEDGRPRPVEVKIEAGVRIEGRGNVVGEKAALEGWRKIARERKANAGDGGRESEIDALRGRGRVAGDGDGGAKKRRANSAPAEKREVKRERIA